MSQWRFSSSRRSLGRDTVVTFCSSSIVYCPSSVFSKLWLLFKNVWLEFNQTRYKTYLHLYISFRKKSVPMHQLVIKNWHLANCLTTCFTTLIRNRKLLQEVFQGLHWWGGVERRSYKIVIPQFVRLYGRQPARLSSYYLLVQLDKPWFNKASQAIQCIILLTDLIAGCILICLCTC